MLASSTRRDPMLTEFRSNYGTTPQALIDYLLAPAGFWGHSAEDTVAEERRDEG